MSKGWVQVKYANNNVELFNMDLVAYLLKNEASVDTRTGNEIAAVRKIGFLSDDAPILLSSGDTLSGRTQQEVETFFGAAFVKMVLDDTTLFVPVQALKSIKKVGSKITVKMVSEFVEATGTITPITSINDEFK